MWPPTLAVMGESHEAHRIRELNVRIQRADEELMGIRRQMSALEESNREVLKTNHQLTASNAVLRSSNEELLVSSEEVRAAAALVESLIEALLASNQELETLNQELQATVEDLNVTNGELEARTIELEAMMARGQTAAAPDSEVPYGG